MEQNLVWLSTSLFCCKSAWNRVLSKGIKPFVSKFSDENRIKYYQLQFNYIGGENIRFALLTKKEQAEELAKEIDTYFKIFFSNVDLPKKEIKLPIDGLFLPFPANTIQHGLYTLPQTDDPKAICESNFQRELSLLMIEALGEESIDEEIILTFAFYLHVAWIKTIIQYSESREELIRLYNQDTYIQDAYIKNQADILPEIISAKLEDNRDMLLEITHDIMNHQQPEINDKPYWLKRWIKLCEGEIGSALRLNEGQDNKINLIHNRMVQTINRHLGITESMRLILFYFIRNTFLTTGSKV